MIVILIIREYLTAEDGGTIILDWHENQKSSRY